VQATTGQGGPLARRLGVTDAVVIGLGSMLGAGVFVAFAPAARAAGGIGLLAGLAIAAVIAFCNATSSASLAARYPESGGSYVYGRERLGPGWGFLAGWAFVAGKTASCAAMALAIGQYAAPEYARAVAVAAVVALTAVNAGGITRTARLTRILVAVVLSVLALVVTVGLAAGSPSLSRLAEPGPGGPGGVLQAAALLFFAFAGYARIATLGEEVRDPERTIPRAVPVALGVVLAVYAVVAVTALAVLGPHRLAGATAPLADVVDSAGAGWLTGVVRAGAAVAVAGVLLSLIAGVGRTTLAMARRGDLPRALGAVAPRHQVPLRAELAVAAAVTGLVLLGDLRTAIGFSSFTVLVYYAVANASAYTLPQARGRRLPTRLVAAVGLAGCLVLAACVPWQSLLAGAAVLAAGMLARQARRRLRP
jgi:APA family basic amino acid/polyamine antiporter